MKVNLICSATCVMFSIQAFCNDCNRNLKQEYHGNIREIKTHLIYPHKIQNNLYLENQELINPTVFCEDSSVSDIIYNKSGTIFKAEYSIGALGLRRTFENNEKASQHIVLSGDSNIFGVGISDKDTVVSNLASNNKNIYFLNLGLAGTGPSQALYFMQKIGVKDLLTNRSKGLMIYDFRYYLIERVVGSKVWAKFYPSTPWYALDNNQLIFKGDLRDNWNYKFYRLLNKIPFSDFLIPNFPRIGKNDIDLVVKILEKMRDSYLGQTNAKNLFIVNICQVSYFEIGKDLNQYFEEKLKSAKINFFITDKNIDDNLDKIKGDGHYSAIGSRNYAKYLDPILKNYFKKFENL